MIRDKDRRATLVHNFIAGHEYEVVVRATGPDGVQEARESAARATIMIHGKLTTPSPPPDLATDGYLTSILLTWVNPLDYDVKHVEIWRATTNARSLAVKIANVTGITYIDAIGASNSTRYYWLRAVNTSGEVSDYTDSVVGTSSGIVATDIDDFSVVATKMFTNTVILSGDVWSNNSPGGGSVAWNAHYITFGGAYYLISAGNTALRYVTWTEGDTGGSGTVADPYLSSYAGGASWTAVNNKFNIAINESGIHQLVWNSSANMVIGSAFILNAAIVEAKIDNLAVTNAKIRSCNVSKLTAGTILSKTITLNTAGSVDCYINTGKTQWDNTQAGFILGIDDTTAKFLIGDADHFFNWDGVAVTVQGTTQTTSAGQRIVQDGANNKISLFVGAGAGTEVLKIDDNVGYSSNIPGIEMNSSYGGEFYVKDTDTSNYARLISTGLIIDNQTADIHYQLTGAGGITARTAKITGVPIILMTLQNTLVGNTALFTINSNADIDTTGSIIMDAGKTVDGVDISAHVADTTTFHSHNTNAHTMTIDGVDISTHIHDAAAGEGPKITHANILGVNVNDHHNQSHTIASHSDQVAHDDMVQTYPTNTFRFTDALTGNPWDLVFEDGILTSVTEQT